jgi:hypothetical protein
LTPPERCNCVAPIVIERSEGGYGRVALGCGTVGPVMGSWRCGKWAGLWLYG